MSDKIGTPDDSIFRITGFEQKKLSGIYRAEIITTVGTPKIHFIGIARAKKSEPVTIRYADI